MEFSPANNIVRRCMQGMELEEKGRPEEAAEIFSQAWKETANDFEKFLAAYYVARHQKTANDKLYWLKTTLQYGLKINDDTVKSAFASLYLRIAQCYEDLHDTERSKENVRMAVAFKNNNPSDKGPFYHGTKAGLQAGDLLTPGGNSNYISDLKMNHIYFTALPNNAGLAAELAKGDTASRVYIVEPTGSFENDPNVTDKKFPGNPTRSYRSSDPLKIVGETTEWVRLTPEELRSWRDKLANIKGDIIN